MFRWVLWKWEQRRHETTYYMRAHTREPLHAYLFHTTTKPIKAVINEPRRGGYCIIGDYWWPMPIAYWQQLQPGDTLEHNFTTDPLPIDIPTYLMVFCSPDPTFLGSTSPIWAVLPPPPPYYALLAQEPWNIGLQPWRYKPPNWTQLVTEPWSS